MFSMFFCTCLYIYVPRLASACLRTLVIMQWEMYAYMYMQVMGCCEMHPVHGMTLIQCLPHRLFVMALSLFCCVYLHDCYPTMPTYCFGWVSHVHVHVHVQLVERSV